MTSRQTLASFSRSETGLSLIEVLVASGLVASGVMALSALFVQADASLRAAKRRTIAATLARAALDRLVTDIDLGAAVASGSDRLDAVGRSSLDAPGLYLRRWTVAPLASDPELLRVEVEVTPVSERGSAGQAVRLRTLRRRT